MSANDMIQLLSGNSKFTFYGIGKEPYSKEELQKYGLPEAYTREEVLTIVGIRYMLSANAYKKYVPVTLSGNVSQETVAYILENSDSLTGITIGQDWNRVYTGGEAFSHILGYTGEISSEEMEKYADSDKEYTFDSVVGKSGIEQYMEDELQGIDGKREVLVNNVGKVTGGEKVIQEAVSGKDVYLSIDKDLQIAVYHILERNLAGIVADNLVKGIADENGNLAENNALSENKVELPDFIWDAVGSGMVQFAQNNSVLQDMEISIAGKTGTAQKSKVRPDHALFVGYAPADAPEITLAVRIANGYGSSNSTAVGRDIFNYYFGL